MLQRFRNILPVCFLVALFRILTGKLRYSYRYLNKTFLTEDGSGFTIFRQITNYTKVSSKQSCVFIVSFKFKHLSHNANRIASKIPMLIIAGRPGFVSKCYAVNHKNCYWLGIYQWKTLHDLETYQNSFVFRMMNKRAIPESIQASIFPNHSLEKYIKKKLRKNCHIRTSSNQY